MDKLSISQNEVTILRSLGKYALRQFEIIDITQLPSGSVGTTLTRMVDKGWLLWSEHKMETPTPVAETYKKYRVSILGRRALRAWNTYFVDGVV